MIEDAPLLVKFPEMKHKPSTPQWYAEKLGVSIQTIRRRIKKDGGSHMLKEEYEKMYGHDVPVVSVVSGLAKKPYNLTASEVQSFHSHIENTNLLNLAVAVDWIRDWINTPTEELTALGNDKARTIVSLFKTCRGKNP